MMKFSVDLMSIGRHNLSFPTWVFSHQYSSVTQLCPTLCNPMDCSTGKPGFPVHHQFLELPQTHVHWVGDAIQPSHLLLFPSPPAFPGGSEVKASARNAGDVGSIPGLGISPGERNGNPLQYSCLENPMDGRAWQAIGHGTERFHFHFHFLSSCLQSFPASGSFPVSQFFTSGGQGIELSSSASVLPMNIQDWIPLGWTGWISLLSKGLSRVFSNTTVQKHQFFGAQFSF